MSTATKPQLDPTYLEAQDLYSDTMKDISKKAYELGLTIQVIDRLRRMIRDKERSRRMTSVTSPESEEGFLHDIMFLAGQRELENAEFHEVLLKPRYRTELGEHLAQRLLDQLRTHVQQVTVFASRETLNKSGLPLRIIDDYPAFCIVLASNETVTEMRKRFPVGLSELSDTMTARNPLRPMASSTEIEALERTMTYNVVQFRLPIRDELKERIEATGARIIYPQGSAGLVVLATDEAVVSIREFPEVREVKLFTPDVRVNTDLPIQTRRTGIVPGVYRANFFTKEDGDKAEREFAKAGIEIIDRPSATRLILNIIESDDALRDLLRIIEQKGLRRLEEEAIETPSNDVARFIVGQGVVSPHEVFPQFPLTGKGEVLAIADSGLDTGIASTIHLDFRNRVRVMKSYPVRPFAKPVVLNVGEDKGPGDIFSGHGTHVAGSAVGSGAQAVALGLPPIQGIAPDAELIVQAVEQPIKWDVTSIPEEEPTLEPYGFYGVPHNLATLYEFAYKNGARVHLNSWNYKQKKGEYTDRCEDLDEFVWEHKDFLVVVAAGNGGVQKGATIESMSVSPPATAKNCLTVGASENNRPGQFNTTYGEWWPKEFPDPPFQSKTMVDSIDHITPFSGRGPCAPQNRLKPDLMAPGTFILSTRSSQLPSDKACWSTFSPAGDHYMYLGGTSMAAPLVAGAALLVRQYLRTEKKIPNPSAALVKAALIHSAAYMNCPNRHPSASPWSDNEQGWGRLCLENVLAPNAPMHVIFLDREEGLTTGQKHDYIVRVTDTSVPLKVTLVYNDYVGEELVNNLNLQLYDPDENYFLGNDFDDSQLPDTVNNVEGVLVHPKALGEWKITVVGTLVNFGPQDYALVISGGGAQFKSGSQIQP